MLSQILSNTNYMSTIKGNPIELLKEIKKLSLNAQDTKYDAAIVTQAMTTFLGCCQKEKENLQDYTRQFKTS